MAIGLVGVAALPAEASPATYSCSAPASSGSTTTFDSSATGIANNYSVACYGVSGVAGTPAYPSSITIASGTLPADVMLSTTTSSVPPCTQSTSGSGTTEEYILTCPLTEDAVTSDNGTYPVTFTANPGGDGGSAATSGTLTLTVVSGDPFACDPNSTDPFYFLSQEGKLLGGEFTSGNINYTQLGSTATQAYNALGF